MIFREECNGCTKRHALIALLWIFTLQLSGEIQLYLFLSVGTDAQWRCQVGKKGNVYFQNQRIIQIHWTAKVPESRWCLAGPVKARAPVRTSSFGNVAASLADAALPVLMVDQINSLHSAWRPDICWMTACYALLLFLLGSSSFILFRCTVKDIDFNHDSCLSVALIHTSYSVSMVSFLTLNWAHVKWNQDLKTELNWSEGFWLYQAAIYVAFCENLQSCKGIQGSKPSATVQSISCQ